MAIKLNIPLTNDIDEVIEDQKSQYKISNLNIFNDESDELSNQFNNPYNMEIEYVSKENEDLFKTNQINNMEIDNDSLENNFVKIY
jgi:hypothetical protein